MNLSGGMKCLAGLLRRTGRCLLGCAGLLALTVVFLGAALAAGLGAAVCLLGAAVADRLERRASPAEAVPASAEP
jgi:hypothetical protein